jgi:lipopolysaccharide assembly outer membrane protein LptD (OstA)
LGTAVFVAYNLFTLRADHVTYDQKDQTLHANGKVVMINEKGESQRADEMTFRIENGEAIPLH